MMRVPLYLLALLPVLRADVLPTITTTVIQTGTGLASVTGNATPFGNGWTAFINGSTQTFPPSGYAEADIFLQGEFVASGSGLATLTFSGSGISDGSPNGGPNISYQINDVSGICGFAGCTGGLNPGGMSETIALGVPFYLSLSASAVSFSGFFPEDQSYSATMSFSVTVNGQPVTVTEVPLPTPEPALAGIAGAALVALLGLRYGMRRWGMRVGAHGVGGLAQTDQ